MTFGRINLFQFLSVRLAEALRVGTIQVRSRRNGEGSLAGFPVIQ